jgi:hypothetical protein
MTDQNPGEMEVLSGLIIRDLNLEEENSVVFSNNLEELKSKLEKIIAYLLDNEFERLLNAMYRLDINEDKFKEALAFNGSQDISSRITELIIEREIQKVKTRIRYKS